MQSGAWLVRNPVVVGGQDRTLQLLGTCSRRYVMQGAGCDDFRNSYNADVCEQVTKLFVQTSGSSQRISDLYPDIIQQS